MTSRADIVIRTEKGQIIAIVEIKNRKDITPEIATTFRRNMIAHGLIPQIPYFLLLS